MAVKFILILALLQLIYAAPGPDPVPDPDVNVNVEQKVDTSCGCCNCDCDDNKEFSGADILDKFTDIAKLVDIDLQSGGWWGVCEWFPRNKWPWCGLGTLVAGNTCPKTKPIPLPWCYAWTPPFNFTCCTAFKPN